MIKKLLKTDQNCCMASRSLLMRFPKVFLLTTAFLTSCVGPVREPDTQGTGTVFGAMEGAASGAITGFNLGIGTGPGALVGAGLGGLAGGMQGYAADVLEQENLKIQKQITKQERIIFAHQILKQHYEKRLRVHPSREIFPADIFFSGDERKIRQSSVPIVEEIAKLTKERMPWSRFAVISYVKSNEEVKEDDLDYNTKVRYQLGLTEARAKEISNYLIKAGIEPRRILARGTIIAAPILVDPEDKPLRYSQAIEFALLDK